MEEVNWDEYFVDKDDWGRRIIIHDVSWCFAEFELTFGLQDGIDWALEHNKTCIGV